MVEAISAAPHNLSLRIGRSESCNRLLNRRTYRGLIDDLTAIEHGQCLVRARFGFVADHCHLAFRSFELYLLSDAGEDLEIPFHALYDYRRPGIALVLKIRLGLIYQAARDCVAFDIAHYYRPRRTNRICFGRATRGYSSSTTPQQLHRSRTFRSRHNIIYKSQLTNRSQTNHYILVLFHPYRRYSRCSADAPTFGLFNLLFIFVSIVTNQSTLSRLRLITADRIL